MKVRCREHGSVIEDEEADWLISKQEDHIWFYHRDDLRERGLDAIRQDSFEEA